MSRTPAVLIVLVVGHLIPAAKPITDRELLEGLGDPANAARRAKVTPELEKPDTIRWLFRVAGSDDKQLREPAAAWVAVWLANKPPLTEDKLAGWGKRGELSRLVCATLEHKQRLKPITTKPGRNDPEPELPVGADLDPSGQLGRQADTLFRSAIKATDLKLFDMRLSLDGWDHADTLSQESLPHWYVNERLVRADPFGRRPPFARGLCCEGVSNEGLLGSPHLKFDLAVFGRVALGKYRGHVPYDSRMDFTAMVFIEGDVSFHMTTLPRFLWVNGDITIERSLDEEKCGGHLKSISGLVICQGVLRTNGGSVHLSGSVLATANEVAKSAIRVNNDSHLVRTSADWLNGVKASSPADYGVSAKAEKETAVIATVVEGKPLGKAGVAVGDVIAAVNGFVVKNPLQLGRELCRAEVGKGAAVLKVLRGKDTLYLHVKLSN